MIGVIRGNWSRMAFTSQAIETPRVGRKRRFDDIIRRLRSQGQCCPQFAPIFWGGQVQPCRPAEGLLGFARETARLGLRGRKVTVF
jgi:hypothetical protein